MRPMTLLSFHHRPIWQDEKELAPIVSAGDRATPEADLGLWAGGHAHPPAVSPSVLAGERDWSRVPMTDHVEPDLAAAAADIAERTIYGLPLDLAGPSASAPLLISSVEPEVADQDRPLRLAARRRKRDRALGVVSLIKTPELAPEDSSTFQARPGVDSDGGPIDSQPPSRRIGPDMEIVFADEARPPRDLRMEDWRARNQAAYDEWYSAYLGGADEEQLWQISRRVFGPNANEAWRRLSHEVVEERDVIGKPRGFVPGAITAPAPPIPEGRGRKDQPLPSALGPAGAGLAFLASERGDAFIRGVADVGSVGLADEFAAMGSTLFGDGTYSENLWNQRLIDQYDNEHHFGPRFGGQIVGAATLPSGVAKSGFGAARKTLRGGMGRADAVLAAHRATANRLAWEGGGYGAAYGFGSAEGSFGNRVKAAAKSAAPAAAFGYGVGRIGSRLFGRDRTAFRERARADAQAPQSPDQFDLLDDILVRVPDDMSDPVLAPGGRGLEDHLEAGFREPSAQSTRAEPLLERKHIELWARTMAPLREASSTGEAARAAMAYLRKPLRNAYTNIVATVSAGSLKKIVHSSAREKSSSVEDHSLALANLDRLFESAIRYHRGPDAYGETSIRQVHRFVSPLQTRDGIVPVTMLVKETTHPGQPNPLYTLETIRIGKPQEELWLGDLGGEMMRALKFLETKPRTGSVPEMPIHVRDEDHWRHIPSGTWVTLPGGKIVLKK